MATQQQAVSNVTKAFTPTSTSQAAALAAVQKAFAPTTTTRTSTSTSGGGSTPGYTLYNPDGSVKSFTPAAEYQAQLAADIAAGRETPSGVAGKIDTTKVGTPIAGTTLAPGQPVVMPPYPQSKLAETALTDVMGQYKAQELTSAQQQQMAGLQQAGVSQPTQNKIMSALGFLGKKEDVLSSPEMMQQRAIVQQRQQEVNQATGALNAILTKQQQDLISSRGTAEKEGVTEAVYGGIQNEINRSAALQALPASAALAAAQGNLQLAQDNMKIYYDMKKEQVDNAYEYKQNVFNTISKYVDQEDQRAYEAIKLRESRAYAEGQQLIETQSQLTQMAYSNRAPQSVVNAIKNARTVLEATNAAGQYGTDILGRQLKQAQIDSAKALAIQRTTGAGGGVGGQYATDLDATIGTVLSTIPTKFGQQQFSAQLSRARNDADKLSIVAAQILKGQPAEFKNDFRNQAVGISQLDKAIALIDSGVQTGALQAGTQYAYNLAGQDFDPKLAQLNSYITAAIQPYRNSVTGAAWGDQEDAEYQQLFGSTKYSPTELRQRLVQTKELLKSKSSEGLNAIANPVGAYDNQFAIGTLTPNAPPATNVTSADTALFDSVVGTGTGGGGFWSSLWKGITGQ